MKFTKTIITLACALAMAPTYAARVSGLNLSSINVAASGTLPACSSGTVVPLQLNNPYANPPATLSWTFYSCYTGAKSLKVGVRKIRLIGVDGTTITAYENTATSITPIDIVTTPLDILKDVDTASLIGSNFRIDQVELTIDNVVQVNAVASFVDHAGDRRVCGTTDTVFGGGSNTQSNPLENQGGTMNGRPGTFYQKNGGNSNTRGAAWLAINALPFTPSGYSVDAYSFSKFGASTYTSAYASAISANLDASASPIVKRVATKIVDTNGDPAGYDSAIGGYNARYLVSTIQLRNPISLARTSKFNIDLQLDLSKTFAWAMYYSTNGTTVNNDADCQQLTIGPILLKVRKAAAKDN